MSIPRALFLGFIIMFPIFISVGSGNIGLDRMGGFASPYFITLPISIIMCLWLIAIRAKYICKSLPIISILFFALFVALLKTIYNIGFDLSQLKILTWMMLFIVSIYTFQNYFEGKIKDVLSVDRLEKYYILYPFLSVIIVTFASHFIFDRGTFLMHEIKIYNYEQYFAFLFVLILGCFSKYGIITVILLFVASLFISSDSVNSTAMILLLTFFIIYMINEIFPYARNIIYKAVVVSVVTFFIIFPFVLYAFYGSIVIDSPGLEKRGNMVSVYFSGIQWYQIVLPFLNEGRSFRTDMHNELLEVFNATGIFGILLYYSFILKKLLRYVGRYRNVGIAILLVIFMGGVAVENTLHPYMLIILSYLISFYYVASMRTIEESSASAPSSYKASSFQPINK